MSYIQICGWASGSFSSLCWVSVVLKNVEHHITGLKKFWWGGDNYKQYQSFISSTMPKRELWGQLQDPSFIRMFTKEKLQIITPIRNKGNYVWIK